MSRARCRTCGETVQSRNRYSRTSCSCGGVTIDLGRITGDSAIIETITSYSDSAGDGCVAGRSSNDIGGGGCDGS